MKEVLSKNTTGKSAKCGVAFGWNIFADVFVLPEAKGVKGVYYIPRPQVRWQGDARQTKVH